MKILVPIKRVLDANVKPRIKADGSGIELQNVKMSANPFDDIALEAAIQLKEASVATEIIAISIGALSCQETLRTALAMGADRAILIQVDQPIFPLTVAKLLKIFVDKEKPDLVIMGKQAIDDDSNQTGQMLAALLDWPQGTFASKITITDHKVEVVREIDGGHQILNLDLPAIITTDLRLNTPRFAKMPDIMKARQKNIEIFQASSLSIDLTSRLVIKKVTQPLARRSGQKVENVQQLIDKLRHEAKVIE